ncbi:MAG: hypothetical protein AB7O57_05700 [Hyphomicrobiaceae bacterium]
MTWLMLTGGAMVALISMTLLTAFFRLLEPLSAARLLVGSAGAFGFLIAPDLPAGGASLDRVELPAVVATSITARDGARYALIEHMRRVQRYDPTGRFERGWFVDSAGGLAGIGMTREGLVAVASYRRRHVELFDSNGMPVGAPVAIDVHWKGEWSKHLQPGALAAPGLTIAATGHAPPPPTSWRTLALLPLWHPLVAWLMMLVAFAPSMRGWARRPAAG